jgi:hypothetical protein
MNANEQNLVTADKYFDVEISGTWTNPDTTNVIIDGYTTDATRYINIYTTGEAKHNGKWDTGAYRLITSSSTGTSLSISDNYVTINGLQISGENITSTYVRVITVASNINPVIIKNNIIKARESTAGAGGIIYINVRSFNSENVIYNNIIYNATGTDAYGIYLTSSDAGTIGKIYNNTIYNCKSGLLFNSSSGTYVVSNNLLMGCTTCINGVSNIDEGENNATNDGTGDDNNLEGGIVDKTSYSDYFVSTTSGSEDFHLKSTATDFIGAGVDLSATFTDDIDGDTRSSWDIGADEYVSAVVATTKRRMLMGCGI